MSSSAATIETERASGNGSLCFRSYQRRSCIPVHTGKFMETALALWGQFPSELLVCDALENPFLIATLCPFRIRVDSEQAPLKRS